MTIERNWTDTGQCLLDRDAATVAGHLWTTRDEIEAAIDRLVWEEVPPSGIIGGAMSPMLGIGAAIDELDLRRVTHVAPGGYVTAWCDAEHATSAYSLYGIRNRYANGTADVFVVDRGTDLIPVRSDFTPAVPA